MLRGWEDDIIVDQILHFMAKAETTVGAVTGLLVVCAVQGSSMCKREILWERPRFKGYEVPPFGKNLKCLRQRHVESMKDPVPSGQVL